MDNYHPAIISLIKISLFISRNQVLSTGPGYPIRKQPLISEYVIYWKSQLCSLYLMIIKMSKRPNKHLKSSILKNLAVMNSFQPYHEEYVFITCFLQIILLQEGWYFDSFKTLQKRLLFLFWRDKAKSF